MKIFEVTMNVDSDDIGLMTFDEYIKRQNVSGKVHPSDAYDFDIDKLNRSYYIQTRMASGSEEFRYHYNERGAKITKGDKLYGIIINNVLYTKKHQSHKIKPNIFIYKDGNDFKEDTNIKLDRIVYVKYYDELVSKLDNTANKNLSDYPVVLNRFIDNGEQFTIRSETKPEKNKGHSIVILNEEGYVVGLASNEWGTTLISVAKEYRGRNLGEALAKVWYKINPDFRSGGYTPQGYRNAKKLWSSRVRELLSHGVYSDLIKRDKISKEKVDIILKDVQPVSKPRSVKKVDHKPDILVMMDDFQFVVYDKKFFENQSEDYIYSYGFIRDLPSGELYPYTLDWDNRYKKIGILAMFSIEDEPLNIVHDAADFVDDIDQYDEIIIEDGFATVDKSTRQLFIDLAEYEMAYRKKNDPYNEVYNSLIEMASYKWD